MIAFHKPIERLGQRIDDAKKNIIDGAKIIIEGVSVCIGLPKDTGTKRKAGGHDPPDGYTAQLQVWVEFLQLEHFGATLSKQLLE